MYNRTQRSASGKNGVYKRNAKAESSIISDKKNQYPDIRLEAAIPYRGRLKTKNSDFQTLLKYCDQITVACEEYIPSCYMRRNRYMVDESQLVIAVYDGRDKGGTWATIRYAYKLQRELQIIPIAMKKDCMKLRNMI